MPDCVNLSFIPYQTDFWMNAIYPLIYIYRIVENKMCSVRPPTASDAVMCRWLRALGASAPPNNQVQIVSILREHTSLLHRSAFTVSLLGRKR
jgi:hypothetical protein